MIWRSSSVEITDSTLFNFSVLKVLEDGIQLGKSGRSRHQKFGRVSMTRIFAKVCECRRWQSQQAEMARMLEKANAQNSFCPPRVPRTQKTRQMINRA